VVEPSIHHVVMFSGGTGSYCAAKRVVEQHGGENVTLLFADTGIEDEDLYRFLPESAQRLGAHLEVIAEGRTPWQLFRDKRFIGNARVDLCSRVLKRELLDTWVETRYGPHEVTCYIGVDWSEIHRFERLAPRKLPYIYKAPLCDPPYMTKDAMLAEMRADGIEPPRLYAWGFPHNNCGGFCVKAGHASFRLLLEKLPERYATHEAEEQRLREYLGKPVAILKDRRGGRTQPLTLREFRERVQDGEETDQYDFGGCGCALE
jgi:hypothetical protein